MRIVHVLAALVVCSTIAVVALIYDVTEMNAMTSALMNYEEREPKPCAHFNNPLEAIVWRHKGLHLQTAPVLLLLRAVKQGPNGSYDTLWAYVRTWQRYRDVIDSRAAMEYDFVIGRKAERLDCYIWSSAAYDLERKKAGVESSILTVLSYSAAVMLIVYGFGALKVYGHSSIAGAVLFVGGFFLLLTLFIGDAGGFRNPVWTLPIMFSASIGLWLLWTKSMQSNNRPFRVASVGAVSAVAAISLLLGLWHWLVDFFTQLIL